MILRPCGMNWRNHNRATAFSRTGSQTGFTFLEIMLVVVIIGILVSIVGPRLVGQSEKAKVGASSAQLSNLKTCLTNYELNASRFPTTDEGLEALIEKPGGLDDVDWAGPYLDSMEVPEDPWHNPYQYRHPPENHRDYDLWSYGPDGQDGTEDDITNWKKRSEQE